MGRPIEPKAKVHVTETGRGSGRRARTKPGEALSPAGAKIVAAFEEAVEAMRSGEPLEARFTVRTYKADFTPRAYGPDDVRRVRGLLGMSQAVFARFLGVDANTVRSWEQGARPPSPIARRFLGEIESDPGYWRRRVAQSAVVDAAGGTAS
jgi:putative transcriptional regulator